MSNILKKEINIKIPNVFAKLSKHVLPFVVTVLSIMVLYLFFTVVDMLSPDAGGIWWLVFIIAMPAMGFCLIATILIMFAGFAKSRTAKK